MEVGVVGDDATDAVFAHEVGGVCVMEEAAPKTARLGRDVAELRSRSGEVLDTRKAKRELTLPRRSKRSNRCRSIG